MTKTVILKYFLMKRLTFALQSYWQAFSSINSIEYKHILKQQDLYFTSCSLLRLINRLISFNMLFAVELQFWCVYGYIYLCPRVSVTLTKSFCRCLAACTLKEWRSTRAARKDFTSFGLLHFPTVPEQVHEIASSFHLYGGSVCQEAARAPGWIARYSWQTASRGHQRLRPPRHFRC